MNNAILKELQSLPADFKATVVAAELADNGVPIDRIFFSNVSTFNRFVSKDINNISLEEKDNYDTQLLIELNREGIYDMIPEGIVHSSTGKKGERAAIEEIALHRRQEAATRKFFSSFENEFLQWQLQLEIIEREANSNSNHEKNRAFFEGIFGSSEYLDDIQISMVMHILPLSSKIAGDTQLISITLSKILNLPITVVKKLGRRVLGNEGVQSATLGNTFLGRDAVINSSCRILTTYFEVCIGDLSTAGYYEFFPEKRYYNVLKVLLPYFFPADADVDIVKICTPDAQFVLSGEGEESYLGFNSFL